MGIIDRLIRIVLSAVVLFVAFTSFQVLIFQIIAILLGVYWLFIALAGRSPFYLLLGIHTDVRIN